jgi:hypothetical protein
MVWGGVVYDFYFIREDSVDFGKAPGCIILFCLAQYDVFYCEWLRLVVEGWFGLTRWGSSGIMRFGI